jgi:hypothetical protein
MPHILVSIFILPLKETPYDDVINLNKGKKYEEIIVIKCFEFDVC